MIGIWKSHANVYLYIVAVATLVVFGIPLLVVPVSWARLFGWDIPQADHVIVMLGRSLGGVICVLAGFAIKAARTPTVQPFFFGLLLWVVLAMTLIHAYGAISGTQPIAETIEIVLWVVLLIVTLGFYPSSSRSAARS